MFFSVIIPVYNRREIIPRAIESVLVQRCSDYELIVIDDGSTDGTENVLRSYPQINVIRTENRGVSAARNTGIRNSSGRYCAFLDSDDEWFPNKLAEQKRFAETNFHLRAFQSEEQWIRSGVRVNPKKVHAKQGGDFFERSLQLCLVSPSASVVRRDLFDDYGYFDEDLPVCEDYDLWLRILSREEIGYQEAALIYKHGGSHEQLSASRWGMDRFRIYSMMKLLRDGLIFPGSRRYEAVIDVISQKASILIKGAEKRGNSLFAEKLSLLVREITDPNSMHTDCSFLLRE